MATGSMGVCAVCSVRAAKLLQIAGQAHPRTPAPSRPGISAMPLIARVTPRDGTCTAPGFLDNRFYYAARVKVWSCQAARMPLRPRWLFISISHSAV